MLSSKKLQAVLWKIQVVVWKKQEEQVGNTNLVVLVVCHLVTYTVAPVLPVVTVVSVVVKKRPPVCWQHVTDRRNLSKCIANLGNNWLQFLGIWFVICNFAPENSRYVHHADLYPKKSVIVLDELQICPCRIMPSGTWQQSQCEFAVLSTRQQKRINLPMTDNDIQKIKKGIITIPLS